MNKQCNGNRIEELKSSWVWLLKTFWSPCFFSSSLVTSSSLVGNVCIRPSIGGKRDQYNPVQRTNTLAKKTATSIFFFHLTYLFPSTGLLRLEGGINSGRVAWDQLGGDKVCVKLERQADAWAWVLWILATVLHFSTRDPLVDRRSKQSSCLMSSHDCMFEGCRRVPCHPASLVGSLF